MSKNTISTLNRMKAAGEKIAVITSYDASFTRQIEAAGMDVILVGDLPAWWVEGTKARFRSRSATWSITRRT